MDQISNSLERNQSRDKITALQTELANQGLNIKVDGMLGPETKKALIETTGIDNPTLAKEAIIHKFKFTGESDELIIQGKKRKLLHFKNQEGENGLAYIAENEIFIITFENGTFKIADLTEGPIKTLVEQNPTININLLNPDQEITLANSLAISPEFSRTLLTMVGAKRLSPIDGQNRTIIANLPKEIKYWIDGLYSLTFTKIDENIEISSNPKIASIEGAKIPLRQLATNQPYIVKAGENNEPPTTLTPELVNELLKLT